MREIANSFDRLTKQHVTFTTHSFPIMILHELNCSGNSQGRGGIFRASPLKDIDEARAGRRLCSRMRTPAHNEWLDQALNFFSDKQERRTFRSQHPFMTVAKNYIC